jgi:hypothetical protein
MGLNHDKMYIYKKHTSMCNTTSMKVSHPARHLSSDLPADIKRETYVYRSKAAQTRAQELGDDTTMISVGTFNLEVIRTSIS